MRRKVIIAGVFLVLIAVFFLSRGNGESVETATVMRGDVVEELILSGEIQSRESASLQFLGSGELAVVNVKVGDIVQKGQLLARLDTTNLYSAYQQSLANLRSAEAALANVYDQVKGHANDESFTQIQTRTAAESAKDVAYFAMVQAQQSLANASLYAPFSGVVSYVANTVTGINVTAGVPQIEILNPESLYFTVFADQTEVTGIQVGQQAKIILDAFPETEVTGTVVTVPLASSPTEVGVVYAVEVSVPANAFGPAVVRSGMTGDAVFITESATNALYVEPGFVQRDGDTDYLLLENGQKVNVQIGAEGEDRVEVRGDVSEGMTIYQE